MSGRIIKSGSYLPVSSEPFEIPLPLKLELLHGNTLLCVYMISEDMTVDFAFNANTEIPMLTRTDRKLKMADIYYLIRSRIFPENPYTVGYDLARLGLKEYDPFAIIEITHGILPYSSYWIRKAGEEIDYDTAMRNYYYPDYNEESDGADSEAEAYSIEEFLS